MLDEGNREALAIEVGTSIPSARVIRVLDDLIRLYGRPAHLRAAVERLVSSATSVELAQN